jgi:hypothetical protein
LSAVESEGNYSSRRDDDTAMSSRDQVLSSSSRFASHEDSKYKQKSLAGSPMEITSEKKLPALLSRKYPDKLNEGFVVALRARDNSGYHVARQRVAGGDGWILDVVSNATNRDPAAQFLVTFKNKVSLSPSSVYSSFIFHAWLMHRQALTRNVLLEYNGFAILCCWRQTAAGIVPLCLSSYLACKLVATPSVPKCLLFFSTKGRQTFGDGGSIFYPLNKYCEVLDVELL